MFPERVNPSHLAANGAISGWAPWTPFMFYWYWLIAGHGICLTLQISILGGRSCEPGAEGPTISLWGLSRGLTGRVLRLDHVELEEPMQLSGGLQAQSCNVPAGRNLPLRSLHWDFYRFLAYQNLAVSGCFSYLEHWRLRQVKVWIRRRVQAFNLLKRFATQKMGTLSVPFPSPYWHNHDCLTSAGRITQDCSRLTEASPLSYASSSPSMKMSKYLAWTDGQGLCSTNLAILMASTECVWDKGRL